ncbi:hypothetical protein PAXRUDRAFT_410196 [Paxillus rubicundulus Ve08.2h10]|uniref:Uncharacterized protein n=1 Tax=Paxillus rubicundulus Ve08.2h10 TaxID=930991 RepID=A0A0D0CZV7_9AGAM|nr:hypothetical protein PAXRUDRAFT_410196 [Paxillus rubicundulus Ve08.2h10]
MAIALHGDESKQTDDMSICIPKGATIRISTQGKGIIKKAGKSLYVKENIRLPVASFNAFVIVPTGGVQSCHAIW